MRKMICRILIIILLIFGTSGNNRTVESVLPNAYDNEALAFASALSQDSKLFPANDSRNMAEEKDTHKNTHASSSREDIPLDEAHFPDVNFRYNVSLYDENDDGILSLAEREWVKDMYTPSVASLIGIAYFTNITSLDCGHGNLTSIDLSNNTTLRYIDCSNNNLVHINLGNNPNLHTLRCSNNLLTNLEISTCPSLIYLDCTYNGLTILDVSKNTLLEELYCNNNCLFELNAGQCSVLRELCCRENSLAKLNIDNCTSLQYLDCYSNSLTELNLSNKAVLKSLYCQYNNIATFDVSNCQSLTLQPSDYDEGVNVTRARVTKQHNTYKPITSTVSSQRKSDKPIIDQVYINRGIVVLIVGMLVFRLLIFFKRKVKEWKIKEAEHQEAMLFLSRAKQGELEAQYEIAVRYSQGKGIDYNLQEALKWYRRAAEQGHSEAQACFNNLQAYLKAEEQRRIIEEEQERKAWEEYMCRREEEKAKEAEIKAKTKEMISKHGFGWMWGVCNHEFVEFVKIAPVKYIKDYLRYMDKSDIEFWASDIWHALQENPDSSAADEIRWEIDERFHILI